MKKRTLLRLSALVLCAALALSACGPLEDFNFWGLLGSGQAAHTRERRTVPFEEMVYARPNAEQITAGVQRQIDAIRAAQSYDALEAAMDAADPILEDFFTMYTLAELNRYRFANDAASEEEYRWIAEAAIEIELLSTELNRAILQGDYAAQYRQDVGDYYYQYLENSLLLQRPEAADYKKRREQLAADYNNLLTGGTVAWEGEQLTLEELRATPNGDAFAFFDEMAPQFAEMYAELIELDKLTARALGFENPAEMYYLSYSRDFSPADTMALCDNIKRVFSPLAYDAMTVGVSVPGIGLDDAFAQMPGALGQLDAELAEAFEFMTQYGLYDCDAREGKHPGIAFMATLMGYDAPFIYQYWDDSSFYATTTLIHEFGHFYDSWMRYDYGTVFNLDIAETYSQGLELLMQPYFGGFLSEADAENARLESIVDFLISAIIYQAALEEFQIRSYALDSMDSVSLGRLFSEVLAGYGLGAYTDEQGAANNWLEITHLFDTPFYTISYVTSALAALQIWAQSRTDYEGAVETYLTMIRADQNQPFTQLLEEAGLKSIHEPATMREIAGEMQAVFDGASGWADQAA